MAKEKTDATSLFDAMNKNRAKTTAKVKNAISADNSDSNAQNSKNVKKSEENADSIAAKEETKRDIVTQMVNSEFDNKSSVTTVIDNQNNQIEPEKTAGEPEIKETAGLEENSNSKVVQEPQEPSLDKAKASKQDKQDKELQHIHIALPRDVFDKLEIAKKAYYNNKTTYIRNLILDDYEKNKEYYEKLPNIR